MKRYTQVQDTQMLTGGLEHFTVTGADIVPTADADAAYGTEEFNNFYEQARVWEQMIEIFRTRANVVIVSELATGGFSLAVEHNDAIDVSEIQGKIRDLGTVDFGGSTVDLSGVTVTKVDYDLL